MSITSTIGKVIKVSILLDGVVNDKLTVEFYDINIENVSISIFKIAFLEYIKECHLNIEKFIPKIEFIIEYVVAVTPKPYNCFEDYLTKYLEYYILYFTEITNFIRFKRLRDINSLLTPELNSVILAYRSALYYSVIYDLYGTGIHQFFKTELGRMHFPLKSKVISNMESEYFKKREYNGVITNLAYMKQYSFFRNHFVVNDRLYVILEETIHERIIHDKCLSAVIHVNFKCKVTTCI